MKKSPKGAMPKRPESKDWWKPDAGVCWVCGLPGSHIMDGRWICKTCLREAYG